MILILGEPTLTLDDLMQHYVRACDGGSVCLVCGKKLFSQVKRHMRDIHLSIDRAYHCPTCDKYFKNRMNMYNHIRNQHKDWKGINCDSFAVKS